jgi:integrase
MGRAPNGESSIYQGADGKWHTYITVGRKPNGTLDRRHIQRSSAGAVATAANELREAMQRGNGVVSKPTTVGEWLTRWLEEIVEPKLAYKTTEDYRSLVNNHFIPNLGEWKIAGSRRRIEPEYVEAMYSKMLKAGTSSSYVLKAHRVLRTAMKAAMRRGYAARNVCDLIDPPRARRHKVEAHTLEEAQALLAAAVDDPRAARWLIGILLGPRQGEALGLRWPRLNLATAEPFMAVHQQLQRQKWRHGCADEVACAARRCTARRCVPGYEHGCPGEGCGRKLAYACPDRRKVADCVRHQRACPKPCPPGCTRHAAACPQRQGGGLVEVDVKSEKGERDIPLPPYVVELLIELRERQIREAAEFGRDWDPEGLVFTNGLGRPMDPRRDYQDWKNLLERAGVATSRLHAARHTAATFLLASGTDSRVVQVILGHSRLSVTEGYMGVAMDLKRQAVDRIAATLLDGQLATLLSGPAAPAQRGQMKVKNG